MQCHFGLPDLKNMISKHQFATNPIMTILDFPHFPPRYSSMYSPKYLPKYFPKYFPMHSPWHSPSVNLNCQNSLCSVILFISHIFPKGIHQYIPQGIPQGIPQDIPQCHYDYELPKLTLQCHFGHLDLWRNMKSKHQFATYPKMTILGFPQFYQRYLSMYSPMYSPKYSNVFPKVLPSVIMN